MGGTVLKGAGEILGVVLVFFELENTSSAEEYHWAVRIPIDPEALGLSDEELAAISIAAEEDGEAAANEDVRRCKDIYFRTGNFISPASDANSGISPPPGSIAEYEQWSKEKANMAAEQLEAEIAADRREFEQSAGREYNSRGAEVPRGDPGCLWPKR